MEKKVALRDAKGNTRCYIYWREDNCFTRSARNQCMEDFQTILHKEAGSACPDATVLFLVRIKERMEKEASNPVTLRIGVDVPDSHYNVVIATRVATGIKGGMGLTEVRMVALEHRGTPIEQSNWDIIFQSMEDIQDPMRFLRSLVRKIEKYWKEHPLLLPDTI